MQNIPEGTKKTITYAPSTPQYNFVKEISMLKFK